MKKQENFWVGLEKYMWRVVGKSPLPWPYVGVGIVVIVMIVSLMEARYSVVGVRSAREVIERAARVGDYQSAQRLYELRADGERVLGAESELEYTIYPEKVVVETIKETEELLKQYPGHRDILLKLAGLHEKIGNTVQAQEYWEQARVLDPNNPIFAK